MEDGLRDAGLLVAGNGALVRVGAAAVGAVRSLLWRDRFREFRFGAVELLTFLEPPALAVVALSLLGDRPRDGASTVEAVAAIGGAALVLTGIELVAWAVWTWRSMFVGHGVLEDQELVTRGAYALVRHPTYLGGLLVWAGLALAFLDPLAALVAGLYVLPVYLLYLRAEERMLLESFGDPYRRYRTAVPALLPGLGRRRRA